MKMYARKWPVVGSLAVAARGSALTWMVCVAAQAGCAPAPGRPHTGSSTSDLDDLSGESQMTTWTCTGDPCPWGDSLSNPTLAWPADADPVATRLGYSVSPAPYLPAASANGLTILD